MLNLKRCIVRYKGYRNPLDTHNSVMCTVFGENGEAIAFLIINIHNLSENAKDRKL